MFIQTEDTPNPASMKFLPGRPILGAGKLGQDFPNEASADNSPLAQILFTLDGVNSIFLGADFVTVTKSPDHDWAHLKAAILGTLADFLTADMPVLSQESQEQAKQGSADDYEGDTRQTVATIIDLLETRVRPAVAQDGGDITFNSYDEKTGIVYLSLRGACAGCPSSTMTLKQGVENLIKHYVPEVNAVEAAS